MRKKEMKLMNKWDELKSIIQEMDSISSKYLYKECFSWASLFDKSVYPEIRKLYDLYFRYFELIQIEEYQFDKEWFSLPDIVRFELLLFTPARIEDLALRCRNILWNIAVFKTNIECTNCGNDDFRALSNIERTDIYLCCDICNYMKPFSNSSNIFPVIPLIPIIPAQRKKYNLTPSIG